MMQAPEWATHIVSGIMHGGRQAKVWIAKGKYEYFEGSPGQRDMNHTWGIEDWWEGIKTAGWTSCSIEEINVCLENK